MKPVVQYSWRIFCFILWCEKSEGSLPGKKKSLLFDPWLVTLKPVTDYYFSIWTSVNFDRWPWWPWENKKDHNKNTEELSFIVTLKLNMIGCTWLKIHGLKTVHKIENWWNQEFNLISLIFAVIFVQLKII